MLNAYAFARDAYVRLSTERIVYATGTPGPIPVTRIIEYAQRFLGFDELHTDWFVDLMSGIDAGYLGGIEYERKVEAATKAAENPEQSDVDEAINTLAKAGRVATKKR